MIVILSTIKMKPEYIIETVFVILGAASLTYAYFRGNLGNATLDLMERNKRAQDEAIKRLEDSDVQKTQQISHLSGQIDVLKDIPLRKISESLEQMSKSHATLTEYMQTHDKQVADGVKQIIDHIDLTIKSPEELSKA